MFSRPMIVTCKKNALCVIETPAVHPRRILGNQPTRWGSRRDLAEVLRGLCRVDRTAHPRADQPSKIL